jgi:EAL domain-containing protein (putative c-di-GMP-specific phosphodiesterase class I)
MADDFIQLMNEYNIPANRINFEVTESSYSKNHLVLQNINKLIENGSSISLDDFGTGSSNLEYIISVPADIIKFDKMMVQAYFTDNNTKLVMNDIIKMIKSLNKKIVFEGIEELHQLEEAEKLLVDYIQGFYFSKPLYDDDFMDFIKSQEYNKDLN